MRPPPLPSPDRERFLTLPLHVFVRDYPEVLGLLRARVVDPRRHGGHSLAQLEAEREDGSALLSAFLESTGWRPVP